MRPFLIAAVVLLCFSCTKKEYVDRYDKTAPSFFINGFKNFRADRNPFDRSGPFYSWPLLVNYKSDTPKRIHLEVVHRNSKIKCWIEGENDAYPDFVSQLVLYDSSALNGLYNFTLLVAKEGDTVQEFPFQITLAGSENCGEFLLGIRLLGYILSPKQENYFNIRTTIPNPGSDTLIFHHLKQDISLVTIPNCSNGTVFIPKQQIGDTTYSGTGTVDYGYYPGITRMELNVLEEAGPWAFIVDYKIQSR